MQSAQVYCIERVYEDLKKPFVAKDVIRQLIHLDTVVADVFERISLRIQAEKDRVKAIDAKIAACQAKVVAVTERGLGNKATTVFSTAKYPAPKVLPTIKGLYCDKTYEEVPPLTAEPEATHFLPSEPPTAGQRAQLMAEVVDLFERVNPYEATSKAEYHMAKEGLGSLPEQVPTIGSVLLFNSNETPYQNYVLVDNLFGTEFEGEEEQKKKLADAPDTVINRGQGIDYSNTPSDKYRPTAPAMGGLNLPQNLPLPGIAATEDKLDTSSIVSIAPSGQNVIDIPLLPEFATGPTAVEKQGDVKLGPSDLTPPPPPPPPPALNFEQQQPGDAPTSNGIPPPPPPAGDDPSVPPPPPPMDDQAPGEAPPPPPEPAQPANPRATLLDAIRNASLSSLKNVQTNAKANDGLRQPQATTSLPQSVIDKLKRLENAWSGKGDRKERERDHELFKKVPVLKAQEVPTPGQQQQPPPPPLEDYRKPPLARVAMSDDGTDDEHFEKNSNFGDEKNDALAQIKRIHEKTVQKKEEAQVNPEPTRATPQPKPPSQPEPPKPLAETLDANILGLRNRQDSLSMSEASDWSDE
ncbi:carbon catabolite repressor protein [Thraustotheca clavata]|uniref:Carbon catabolite repressor protein n=1 Tax=Thraustotheca clavata TaxID=74557 RepID=A0A1W0A7Z7_9STRA|nr:carbon catabolite repressor protein [Thraustotheca clavata]